MVAGAEMFGLGEALLLAVVLSAIPLGVSMLVGLTLAILQAATQIQEQTLSFVPKVGAVVALFFFLGSWMAAQVVDFGSRALTSIDSVQFTGFE